MRGTFHDQADIAATPHLAVSPTPHAVAASAAAAAAAAADAPSAVTDEAPDLVSVVTEFGRIAYVSETVRRVLGVAPAELVGHRVCDLLDSDGRHNCIAWFAFAQRGAQLPRLVHGARRADGSVAQLETRIRMIRTDDGPSGVLAVSRDLSAQAVIENRPESAEAGEFWGAIVDVIREGVLVLQDDGMVVAANRAAGRLLHVEPAILRGAKVDDFLAVAAAPAVKAPTVLEAVNGFGASGGLPVTERSGSELTARTVPMPAHEGQVVVLLEEAVLSRPRLVSTPVTEPLSPREAAVLRLLADGRDAAAIARELGLSIHTVRAYVKSILRKLDVRSQLQAVIVAVRSGLLDLS